jgi:hypothetical protein
VTIQQPEPAYPSQQQRREHDHSQAQTWGPWSSFVAPWSWNGPNMNVNFGEDPSTRRQCSGDDCLPHRTKDRAEDRCSGNKPNDFRAGKSSGKGSKATNRWESCGYADKPSTPRKPSEVPARQFCPHSEHNSDCGGPGHQHTAPCGKPPHRQYWYPETSYPNGHPH